MLFFPFPEQTRTVDSVVWCQCLQPLPQAPRESLEPAGDEAARGQPRGTAPEAGTSAPSAPGGRLSGAGGCGARGPGASQGSAGDFFSKVT